MIFPYFGQNFNHMKKTFQRLLLGATFSAVFFISCGSSASLLGASSPLMSALGGAGNLGSVSKLLQTPGLDKILGSSLKKPFTLLAPTDNALSGVGNALGDLSKPENLKNLGNIFNKHIVKGKLDPAAILNGGLKSAGGGDLNLGGAKLGNMIAGDKFNIIPVDKILP